jgi:hypothetical protein
VEAGKAAAIDERVWEKFKRFNFTKDEYKTAVGAAFSFTGLRLDAADGRWDSCIRAAKERVIGLIDKAGIQSSKDKLLVGHYNHLPKLKELLELPAQPEAAALGEAANRAEPRDEGHGGRRQVNPSAKII